MKEQIASIKEKSIKEISNSKDLKELNALRVKYLGKKGELTLILRGMGGLSPEERQTSFKNMVTLALESAIKLI